MPDSAEITVRLTPELDARLDQLARQTNRAKATLVNEAIENYVELQDWQLALIEEALNEEGPGIPHEEVMRWVDSWGTANELPRPDLKDK